MIFVVICRALNSRNNNVMNRNANLDEEENVWNSINKENRISSS